VIAWCDHPEAARRTRVETASVVIGRCSACEKDVEFEYNHASSPCWTLGRLTSAIWQVMKREGWRIKASDGWTDLPPNMVAQAIARELDDVHDRP